MADVLEIPRSARRAMRLYDEQLRKLEQRRKEVQALYRAHYYTTPIGKIKYPRR